jgi:hypothetical protein
MKDCRTVALETAQLDPRKLPNYAFGMVLGPTDFRQVLENFEWKHRNSNLLLHGSGTVCGLKISAQPSGSDVQIAVSAGLAISPRGRWIRVEPDQCALLNEWLQAQTSLPYASPGPGAHRIYVTLCYNQCLTDLVPIAGQQCAPDANNEAPSRILEAFRLQFSWTPPAQPLEDRARLFGALMRQVEIVDIAGSLPGADDAGKLLAAIRALAQDPLPLPGSLPAGGPFHLTSADADLTLREALTIWATEICPAIRPKPENSPLLEPVADDCLLLAAIDFSVNSLGQVAPGSVVIDELQRPVLLPSRVLQELYAGAGGTGPGGRAIHTGTVTLAPGGNWARFQTVERALPLPPSIPPDASIELSIEATAPNSLLGAIPANSGNLALTLYRPLPGSLPATPTVAATYLSTDPGPVLNSVTVRWRAYQG